MVVSIWQLFFSSEITTIHTVCCHDVPIWKLFCRSSVYTGNPGHNIFWYWEKLLCISYFQSLVWCEHQKSSQVPLVVSLEEQLIKHDYHRSFFAWLSYFSKLTIKSTLTSRSIVLSPGNEGSLFRLGMICGVAAIQIELKESSYVYYPVYKPGLLQIL